MTKIFDWLENKIVNTHIFWIINAYKFAQLIILVKISFVKNVMILIEKPDLDNNKENDYNE